MKRLFKILFIAVLVSSMGMYSCADLDVENLNAPDSHDVIESPDDYLGVITGAFRLVNNRIHAYSGPMMAMMTMADHSTCSWGNAAMKDLSSEPRVGFNNTVVYSYNYVNLSFWNTLNSTLSQINDVMIEIENGAVVVDAETTDMAKTWGYFMQGVIHGYLGLVLQKAFIVDETTDLQTLEFSDYPAMISAAVGYLDKAILACAANTFTLPSDFIQGTAVIDNVYLGKIANFFAAKFLTQGSRNATENAAVDWGKVKTYATNGLDEDFELDISSGWGHQLMGYAQTPGWIRVDNRVINMMDPNYPSRWNVNGTPPDPQTATSADARLESDFKWYSTVPHRPERGYYHFSYYGYWRFPDFDVLWEGILPVWPKAECDLMLAEAEARTGGTAAAIAIINAGERVTRGGLDPLDDGATQQDVLDAIFYERDVELATHNSGLHYFDMRRRNWLQPGTICHFPVPGKELETLGEEYYSIGSGKGVVGVDYADTDWGWPGWDVQNPYK
jgi:hypothetical protein